MRARRVSITGSNGQLGRALMAAFGEVWTIDALSQVECDICDWRAVRDRIARVGPDLVIHCAAATDVDRCEREPECAFRVNALGARNVARAAALAGAELVYVSTNYVFDGRDDQPYHEYHVPNPISVYGASKLAGERESLDASPRCHVVRTAMLYASQGRNFVTTMRRLMSERDRLSVVADQYGNPTFADDLARAVSAIVDRAPYGIHHAVNSGVASWHDWATEVARLMRATTIVEAIPAADYSRDATPPANGALISLHLASLGIEIADWRDGLRRCISQ
jgi:dTDP-4-dehydrorhamnose reductase